jgi:ABC-type transport system involved in cytochrome bd biosynthesis fused ATPase/permease subunit
VRCGGTALEETDPAEWRERVAWVPQRPTIFSGTLAENVALHDPSAPRHEILGALGAAGGLDLARELPGGLEARVGEGGRRLSAGQAQRVALARAFLRDPSLVVLDEPTAHLDEETAASVGEAIAALMRGRTGLLIAHRPRLVEQILERASGARVLELAGGRLRPLAGDAPPATGAERRPLEPAL